MISFLFQSLYLDECGNAAWGLVYLAKQVSKPSLLSFLFYTMDLRELMEDGWL